MKASHRPPTRQLGLQRHYCVLLNGRRWLAIGVFTTSTAARQAGLAYLQTRPYLDAALEVEPVFVSRRIPRPEQR
jgi:hypothetical protein